MSKPVRIGKVQCHTTTTVVDTALVAAFTINPSAKALIGMLRYAAIHMPERKMMQAMKTQWRYGSGLQQYGCKLFSKTHTLKPRAEPEGRY